MNAWNVEAPSGAELLDDIEAFIARFVVYPGEAERVAHVLWIAHTWFMDQWESTPRIAFLSPEPGSGKSRALEVTEPLVPRPVHAVNVSPTYLFRKVSDEAGPPTILYDEIDTVFGPRAKENEELRGLLNAGHRKGAFAGRCVVRGKNIETEDFPAYCAVALAGLNDLPDTIMTRSVVVRMQRRAPGEKVEPWRLRLQRQPAEALSDRLAEWSNLNQHTINTWPEMPEVIEDRNADVWEALLAVADLAGGQWPERGRVAAVTAVTDDRGSKPSLGIMLLTDMRDTYLNKHVDRLTTTELLEELNGMEESPWGDIRGKQLDARSLSRRLNKYDVKPKTIRDGDKTFKGYLREDLTDAWSRYLPVSLPGDLSVTSVTSVTGADKQAEHWPIVTDVTDVTDKSGRGGEAVTDFYDLFGDDDKPEANTPNKCATCHADLLLQDGRTLCERCRLDAEADK